MSLSRPGRVLLNEGWRFHLDGASGWETISLPHSWNALDTMDSDPAGHYRRGIGTYERSIPPLSSAGGERKWVEFEAASQKAAIYLDGQKIAEHLGGYTAFAVDATRSAQGGVLQVQVDNRPDPDLIPSDQSDFFLYGGITRNVWLYSTGSLRIAAAWIDAEGDADRARLTVSGRLEGATPRTEGGGSRLTVEPPIRIEAIVRSPEGDVVTRGSGVIQSADFRIPLEDLPAPLRWSPDSPAVYRAAISVFTADALSDRVDIPVGIRSISFPAGGPLMLNGRALRLHGTHRHEDWAGCGSAVPDEITRRELRMIRDAGFNFIRLGHYPQSAAALDACDELGLIVWEELPWCRGGVGGDVFKQRTRQMLAEMIDQHRQHPSICFWGLGNELDWEPSDHAGSTAGAVLNFLAELNDLSHCADPSRPTALRRFTDGAAVVDAYSPSIWSGWYRGRYEDYESVLDSSLRRFPGMLHIEWGGDSLTGRHSEGPHTPDLPVLADHGERPNDAARASGEPRASSDGDWSESYILDLIEWHLQVQLRSGRLAGNAQWVFKDFGTPLRPENPIPYVNQKGLVDRAGRPKDAYFLVQSYLSTNPMVYIESPTWAVRTGDPAESHCVRVYSNCARVELLLNGESLGSRQRDPVAFPAAGLVWSVHFEQGTNQLRAVAEASDGRRCEHQITVEYASPSRGTVVGMTAHAEAGFAPTGAPATNIKIQVVDADGRPDLSDRRRIRLSVTGPGRLLAQQGTVDGSDLVELANGSARAWITGAVPRVTALEARVVDGPEATIPI
jgi:beta-galactosidase